MALAHASNNFVATEAKLNVGTRVNFFYLPVLQSPRFLITAVEVVELGHRAVVFCITRQARSCLGNPFQSGHNYRILHEVAPRKHPARLHPFLQVLSIYYLVEIPAQDTGAMLRRKQCTFNFYFLDDYATLK